MQTKLTNPPQVELYADGADLKSMIQIYQQKIVSGFTTNPSLMRKAGVQNYEKFCREVLTAIPDMPISFEVFSDDLANMEREARIISQWGKNVYVKIPITNTKGEYTTSLIQKLAAEGVFLNVTALFTLNQVKAVAEALNPQVDSVVSVFAGRIADTGMDPIPLLKDCVTILKSNKKAKLLWASTRELLNILHAEQSGCHIITVSEDILKKLSLVGKNLEAYSLETVKMFYNDASSAGYKL